VTLVSKNQELGGGEAMAEEHEAKQPYKCAICDAKFDSQEQLVEHLKQCTEKVRKQSQP
jgi:DNA-directed RNA polymerase subunit RPC12/RpoP